MATDTDRRGLLDWLKSVRAHARRTRGGRIAWRAAVTVLGVATVVGGVILLPLPGPGWLIIFAGLGLLATEYTWAARLLAFARRTLRRWTDWLATRSRGVRASIALAGIVVLGAVIAALWWYYVER